MKLSKKDFLKQFEAYRKDPVTFMQSSMNSRGGRGGGRPTPSPQDRKEQEDRLRQSVQKFNNLIELN